jgi:hypothetical protein
LRNARSETTKFRDSGKVRKFRKAEQKLARIFEEKAGKKKKVEVFLGSYGLELRRIKVYVD